MRRGARNKCLSRGRVSSGKIPYQADSVVAGLLKRMQKRDPADRWQGAE
jgi:hypothetical protein